MTRSGEILLSVDGSETDLAILGIMSFFIWFDTVRVPSCNCLALGVRSGSIYYIYCEI